MSAGSRGKALVLGEDWRAFLAVVRSLGRGGVETHGGRHRADSPAVASRYLKALHALPGPGFDSQNFEDALAALARREQFDLILPASESALLAVEAAAPTVRRYSRVYAIGAEARRVLLDKRRTAELARREGVPTPEERLISDLGEAREAVAELGLPLVLKPLTSFDSNSPGGKRFVRKARSRAEAEELLARMLAAGPVVAQRNAPGRGCGVEALMKDGRLLMAFQHERLHEPPDGGGSSYRRGVSVDPRLLEASLKLLAPLGYTGVAMVEFKLDRASGQWTLIEVNPRFWGSLPLAVASGADFPLALYDLLVEGREPAGVQARVGIHCRNWTSDLRWHWENLHADRSDPTLATAPPAADLLRSARALLTLRERSDAWALDDPMPAVAELRALTSRTAAALSVRAQRSLFTLAAVRRFAVMKTRRAAVEACSALFVCKGNICRSPFAAALARKAGLFERVHSAGHLDSAGRRSPPEAIDAARRRGVDLAGHRSQTVDDGLLASAEAVFVFDLENREILRRRFPRHARKIRLLGLADGDGPVELADPWGRGGQAFEDCYDQIALALERIRHLRASAPHARRAAPQSTAPAS